MPVIVVGADTPLGEAVANALGGRNGDVRAFVTDSEAAARLRRRAIKVAVGDVSDGSHIEAAALGCFTAILIGFAAVDDRERSFSDGPTAIVSAWLKALGDAGVRRLIWLGNTRLIDLEAARALIAEVTMVAIEGRDNSEISAEVVRLDDLGRLDEV
ncbi:MAG: NAD(P)H-binding protein [Acidimicrobiia bacterium]